MLAAGFHVEAADPPTSTIGDSKFRIVSTGSVNVGAHGTVTLVVKCAGNEQIISTGIDTTSGNGGKGFSVIDDAPTSHRRWVKRLRNLMLIQSKSLSEQFVTRDLNSKDDIHHAHATIR